MDRTDLLPFHAIEGRLGYAFHNKELLCLALTHRSFVNENRKSVPLHNERLEFLGDSVLGLIAAEVLYQWLPDHPEGELSELRSRLVDAKSCSSYFKKLELEKEILLGKGEKSSQGRAKTSILADAFEALIGAIYLDGGLEKARNFFLAHFQQEIQKTIASPSRNYKADLQDYAQRKFQKPPVYQVVEQTGPDHAKVFLIAVFIEEEELGRGEGGSKKEAEQEAARRALEKLGEGVCE